MEASAFGRYLAQQRELRGMSREEVAQATKIPLGMVSALEAGDVQRMPGRVFILNFIRSYATTIGLEPDDAVLRFEEVASTQAAETQESKPEGSKPQRRWIWGVGVLLALAAAGLLLSQHWKG